MLALLLALLLSAVIASDSLGSAYAYEAMAESEVRAIIRDRATAHGVSAEWMLRIAACESGFRPWVSNGRYHGLYQLGSPGELDRFYARGYRSPFDAWESADFTAARLSEGGAAAWSCA